MKKNLPFFLILIVSFFLRSYHLGTLTTFGGDQGQDSLVVRDMVLFHKWTLLGIKTSAYSFFQGPLYLYMLFPFFVLYKLAPIAGSIAALFYSSMSLLFLYITVKKYFSQKIALISCALFAVSPELIIYGNTPLYQHFLPLFIISSFYFYLIPKRNFLVGFLLGTTLGLGIETHLLNINLAIAITILLIGFKKDDFRVFLGNCLGIVIGLSPTILFELRHNFLNTRLLFSYHQAGAFGVHLAQIIYGWFYGAGAFLGAKSVEWGAVILFFVLTVIFTKKMKGQAYSRLSKLALLLAVITIFFSLRFAASAYFYILPFWILLLILLPFLIERVFSKKASAIVFIFLILINLAATLKQMNVNHGYAMPEGWTLNKVQVAAKIIKDDSQSHPNFNITSLLEGQSKAYSLRYALLAEGATPEPMNNYASNNYLYLVIQGNSGELEKSHAWEVLSFAPYKIGGVWDLGEGVSLYRLDRVSWLKLLQTK